MGAEITNWGKRDQKPGQGLQIDPEYNVILVVWHVPYFHQGCCVFLFKVDKAEPDLGHLADIQDGAVSDNSCF